MQQEDQTGSLSELEPDRTPAHDGLGPGQEFRWEVRAEGWPRTRHGTHPVARAIVASIRGPRSLHRRLGEPYSHF